MHSKTTAGLAAAAAIVLVTSCSENLETPAKIRLKAEEAYAARDCMQTITLYQKLASMDTIYLKIAQERISACTEILNRTAAKNLDKDGKALIPRPPSPPQQAPSPSSPSPTSAAVTVESSVKICNPSLKTRLDQVIGELKPLESELNELGRKVSEVETRYNVKQSPDGGFDFALPKDTTPEEAKAFEDGAARTYADNKAKEALLSTEVKTLKDKIAGIEAEADKAGIPKECLYPPKRGF